MPNDNMLMISRALLQDLFDDVSDYACSREFRAKEKAWRDDLLARVRSLLTAYPGAPEMLAAHPGQPEPRAEVTGWQPIETAPSDQLVTVFWLDSDDEHNPERYDFDMLDDGCWRQWTDHYEWAHSVAPAGSRLPREQAPYTHWKPLGSPVPTDAARTGASS